MRIQDAAAYNLQWTSNEEGKTFLDLDSSAFVHQFVSDFGLSTAVECLVLNHFSASLCFVVSSVVEKLLYSTAFHIVEIYEVALIGLPS